MLFNLLVLCVFLLMMSVLVTVHELGHYLSARLLGMGAEEFAIGFGNKPLFTYMRKRYRIPLTNEQARQFALGGSSSSKPSGSAPTKLVQGLEGGGGGDHRSSLIQTPMGPALEEETLFTVRPLPLGGFVRIKGMMPEEDGSEVHIPGGFYSKNPWQRLIVLFAGPLFSVLAGVLVLIPYLMIVGEGVPNQKPVLGAVAEGKAAYQAGLRSKDQIVAVEGKPVSTFYEVIQTIRDRPNQPTAFTINRAGKTLNISVTPEKDLEPTPVLGPDLKPTAELKIQGRIGASPVIDRKPVGLLAASSLAVYIPFEAVSGLADAIRHPKKLKDSVGGPQTMIVATADATKDSPLDVIRLAALLSISIGIFNLLPFPPLDGGQMVMAIAELFRGGKRLSIRAQSVVVVAGMAIVGSLVLCVLLVDFQRYSHSPAPSQAAVSSPGKGTQEPKPASH